MEGKGGLVEGISGLDGIKVRNQCINGERFKRSTYRAIILE